MTFDESGYILQQQHNQLLHKKDNKMTVYTGHWEQLEANPKYPDQEPTAYLRANKEVNAEMRDTLKVWCEYLSTMAFAQVDSIRYDNPKITKSQALKMAWATLDQAIRLNCDEPDRPVGQDPQVYGMEYTIKFCLKELAALQKNGKPKDIKQSIVDRHNWQVVHWAFAKWDITQESDITDAIVDWLEPRLIDVQTNPQPTLSRANRQLNNIFGN